MATIGCAVCGKDRCICGPYADPDHRRQNLGCIDPHGYYPFPVSREVCPKCQAIRAERERMFSPRHGLRYRWWRDIPWGLVVTCVMTMLIFFTATLLLGAWFFDWKAWW